MIPNSGNGVGTLNINLGSIFRKVAEQSKQEQKFNTIDEWFEHRIKPILNKEFDLFVEKYFVSGNGEKNKEQLT